MSTQTEALKLAAEYRATMPADVMHLWARDVVVELRRLYERVQELESDKQSTWVAGIDEGVSRQRVPEGWQLVPIEPTKEMREAGCEAYRGDEDERGIYQAMLAAATKPNT